MSFFQRLNYPMACTYYSIKLTVLQMVTLFFIADVQPTTVMLVDLELKLVSFEATECNTGETQSHS